MTDVFSRAKRSEVMSRIRSRGNKDTEVVLAKFFRRHKITGWRRQVVVQSPRFKVQSQKKGNGSFRVRPDFIFPKLARAIFVDGCFWHGCPQHGTQPKGNATFWRRKFSANKRRDQLVNRALRKQGWRVLRIWEHDLHRATKRWATKKSRNKKISSTPHPPRYQQKSGRGTSSGLRPPSPQSGEGNLPERSGEGEVVNRHETRLLQRLHRALGI